MLAAGARLGRYEVLFPIAAGGMGTVYAARALGDGGFRKPVALKVPLQELAMQPRFQEMLADEASLSAAIDSPNVVSTFDLARDGTVVFLVMELVVGVGLRSLARPFGRRARYSFPIPEALCILAQAARGLHDAHEARDARGRSLGIVHRDVSPHNILVGADGRVRVTDFGVAYAAHRLSSTRTGEFKGKLIYAAPEQLTNDDVDRRVDVFALGVVAYELLTGVRPFEADNPLAVALNIAQKAVPPVATLRPEVPSEVSDLIRDAMIRDRSLRLPTCAAFAAALEAWARAELRAKVAVLLQTEQRPRLAAFEKALALAADADDLTALAAELEASVPEESSGPADAPWSAPASLLTEDLEQPPLVPSRAGTPPPVPPVGQPPRPPPPPKPKGVPHAASRFQIELDLPPRPSAAAARPVEPSPVAPPPAPRDRRPLRYTLLAGAVLAVSVATLGLARGVALCVLFAMCGVMAWWWRNR
jgi:eukaryotic-like serine/threonine-protein kinase